MHFRWHYFQALAKIFMISTLILIVLAADFVKPIPTENITKVELPEPTINEKLKTILKCHEKPFESKTVQRGKYWVLTNYVRAGHGKIGCHESITLTTHGYSSFFKHIPILIER